jgi:hypothetical protein
MLEGLRSSLEQIPPRQDILPLDSSLLSRSDNVVASINGAEWRKASSGLSVYHQDANWLSSKEVKEVLQCSTYHLLKWRQAHPQYFEIKTQPLFGFGKQGYIKLYSRELIEQFKNSQPYLMTQRKESKSRLYDVLKEAGISPDNWVPLRDIDKWLVMMTPDSVKNGGFLGGASLRTLSWFVRGWVKSDLEHHLWSCYTGDRAGREWMPAMRASQFFWANSIDCSVGMNRLDKLKVPHFKMKRNRWYRPDDLEAVLPELRK